MKFEITKAIEMVDLYIHPQFITISQDDNIISLDENQFSQILSHILIAIESGNSKWDCSIAEIGKIIRKHEKKSY